MIKEKPTVVHYKDQSFTIEPRNPSDYRLRALDGTFLSDIGVGTKYSEMAEIVAAYQNIKSLLGKKV